MIKTTQTGDIENEHKDNTVRAHIGINQLETPLFKGLSTISSDESLDVWGNTTTYSGNFNCYDNKIRENKPADNLIRVEILKRQRVQGK